MQSIDPSAFWKWAFSDFLSNALRGVLAEYIVGTAINAVSLKRTEWDAFDLITNEGVKIEVKSAAYLQSWTQTKPSTIRFDIAAKQSWHAETNSYSSLATRPADIYVFCVFAEKDRISANPLSLDQWFFLVAPVYLLETEFKNQKSVSLTSLEKAGLIKITYELLAGEVRNVIANSVTDLSKALS